MTRRPSAEQPKAHETPRAAAQKLQRWIDLIAELLRRTAPASFEEIARSVPEYQAKLAEAQRDPDHDERRTKVASLKRTFERDKDELRRFGVPIESLPDPEGAEAGMYRLRRKDFYLPYLCVAVPGTAARRPARVDRWGYQALASLTFESDELQAVVDAASAVRALGDPLLTADAASALRKLAVDLPLDAVAPAADQPRVILPRARPDAEVFALLADALARRKVVTFAYHALGTGDGAAREVEPWGVFFLSGHWYLTGRDTARDAQRNFRLNRMAGVSVNPQRSRSADYEIPASFRLREHATSRQAWELGDGEAVRVVVEFHDESGPAMAARKLGAAVAGAPMQRAFDVRRPDAFVRWAMSFAGSVVPVSPAGIVAQFSRAVEDTMRVYDDPAPREVPAVAMPAPASTSGGVWEPKGAAAQLRRILQVVPLIADGEDHRLDEIARRVGSTVEVLRRDLHSLVSRFDVPGGFVDSVRLFIEAEVVSATSDHFLRPMRLTVSELCALELGLAITRAGLPPDEHAVLDRARARLREVIARLPADPVPDALHGASLGDQGNTAQLAAVRTGLRERRKLRLTYRKSGNTTADERTVCPYGLVQSSGMLYLVAWYEEGQGVRIFRLDRMERAEVTVDSFATPDGFSLDAVLSDGRALQRQAADSMRVWYSPRVAPWIAEREGRTLAPDGSLVIDHPLVDWEWGLRHVLQYGAEAEVLQPEEMRERVRERLGVLRALVVPGS